MPDMSGLELIKHLNTQDTDTKIIVISGADNALMGKAKLLGADAVAPKPFENKQLLDVVSTLIKA